MGVPKRKPSKSLKLPQLNTCPQCAAPYYPHRVCPACGFYRGRQVVTVESFG
jgi:large subunit ribosomal protein L32